MSPSACGGLFFLCTSVVFSISLLVQYANSFVTLAMLADIIQNPILCGLARLLREKASTPYRFIHPEGRKERDLMKATAKVVLYLIGNFIVTVCCFRWQKGKLIFLASLSCWIIFTLPLAFMQPPATSCMVVKNNTVYLEAPIPKTRILKRSVSLEDFYHQNDNECLEIAENVVFERLRKDDTLNPLRTQNMHRSRGTLANTVQQNYDLNNNRIRREIKEETTSTEDSPVEDLKYKQLVFEENDPEAKTIDFETLQRKNRPADVLEYKRFLTVSFALCLAQI